jgi:hypothetical protein
MSNFWYLVWNGAPTKKSRGHAAEERNPGIFTNEDGCDADNSTVVDIMTKTLWLESGGGKKRN